ncbi:MAG TPA: tetratricopeptide repeat protein [Terracidiphilus sp.]|nr:tetratricopeptide repeat protein [Terracidiphilus sp.]
MSSLDRYLVLQAAAAAALTAATLLAQPPVEAAAKPAPADSSLAIVVPQPPPTPEEMGNALMAHRRYQAAIEAYKRDARPSATEWNQMGIAYQMMFNAADAMRCYEASLKLAPKDANVLNNLGTVYDSQKDYKRAVKMYRRALKVEPKSAVVLKNLGTDLLAQHQYKKGWEAYQAALAADPRIFDGNAGLRVENPSSAQDRGAMNYFMARGCMRAGMNERAIEYLRSALNEGYISPKKIAADQDFAALRGLASYRQLIAEQEKQ